MWQKRVQIISRSQNSGRLLDIGCGEGLFLKIAKQNGWQVEGVEISEFACREATKNLNQTVNHGEVWEVGFDAETFDVITLWHVLEHGVDPLRTLKEARRVIKPEGLLLVAVPNVNDWFMRMAYLLVKRKPLNLFSPSDKELHLYHFSAKTLKKIIKVAGFTKVKVRPDFGIIEPGKKIINYVGSMAYYLFKAHLYNALEATAVPGKNK
jgi:2-polyprenyl-3-methyl-5-hydroxy-6-metoxy-1,4-benzoquinol methylase